MRTQLIIIFVIAAMIGGLFYRCWQHGYESGYDHGARKEEARAKISASVSLYNSHLDFSRQLSQIDCFENTNSLWNQLINIEQFYEFAKEDINTYKDVIDSQSKNLVQGLDDQHSSNVEFIRSRISKVEKSTAKKKQNKADMATPRKPSD